MIDIRLIRTEPERVVAMLKKRGRDEALVANAASLDEQHRALLVQLDALRAKRNAQPKGKPSEEELVALKGLSEEIKVLEADARELQDSLAGIMRQIPNLLAEDVPEGKSDAENELIRTVGEIPQFAFPVKDHLEIGEALGIIDMERAANVAGSRFVYLKGDGVLLQMGLLQLALSTLAEEGFVPVLPPHIVSIEAMDAMGYLTHGGEDEIYHLKNDDAVLIGTSEQAIGPMHMNEHLDADQLPLRYVGYSPCYRREAGSYGKDTRGILRVHQFDKIEMFAFTTPETSDDEHHKLLALQERLMQALALPYQVMRLCAGDTGTPSSRTYDINTWMPGQEAYRETHSTSNTTDYQTRRLGTKTTIGDERCFVHALNGTVFAIGRVLIAILENGQEEDGRVRIPEVLQPYMGGRTHLEPIAPKA